MIIYRLSKKLHSAEPYSGEGGRFAAGRWNRLGTLMAYASGSRPMAFLEVLARIKANDLRNINRLYVMCPAEIPNQLVPPVVPLDTLPRDWRAFPAPASTQEFGEQWIASRSSLVLTVPSALMPSESNYVINPLHHHFAKLRVLPSEPLSLEPRLLKVKG
jgi:RES domain-containing protein